MNIKRIYRGFCNIIKDFIAFLDVKIESHRKRLFPQSDSITIINTETGSNNLGDTIIMKYCKENLKDIVKDSPVYEIASHTAPSKHDIDMFVNSRIVIVCGTNFLSPRMAAYSVWKFDKKMIHSNNVMLMAVGWGGVKLPSIYSKFVYKTLLNNGYLQSVRDEFTANQLRRIGIKNVINTNCVTLWGLDKSCRNIPAYKSNCVVFTVTGYMKDKQFDIFMVELLTKLYDTVYFWPQGDTDLDYLKSICNLDGINVLDRTLEAYETALTRDSIDYVGSRLHGGIYALHHCKRTIIIAVDNRAWKMHLDTNLPVIKSSDAKLKLEQLILTNWKTEIHLNTQAMEQWKEELRKSIAAE